MNRVDVTDDAKEYKGYQGNPNKFTKWYWKDNKTHAWCGAFIKYIFKHDLKCDWLDDCSNFGYVPTIVAWAKKKGYWTTDYKKAQRGDLVAYNWTPKDKKHLSHVGIIEEVKDTGIKSIEGNTTNAAGKKNCVAEKNRNKKYISGVILLPFKEDEQFNLKRILKPGCKGDDVKELQKELKKRGYDLGTYGPNKDGIDGKFGKSTSKTSKAVRKFQKENGLEVDTEVGKNTAHALGWLYMGK